MIKKMKTYRCLLCDSLRILPLQSGGWSQWRAQIKSIYSKDIQEKKNTKKIQNMKSKEMNGNIKHLSLFCPKNIITISKLAMLYSFLCFCFFLSLAHVYIYVPARVQSATQQWFGLCHYTWVNIVSLDTGKTKLPSLYKNISSVARILALTLFLLSHHNRHPNTEQVTVVLVRFTLLALDVQSRKWTEEYVCFKG